MEIEKLYNQLQIKSIQALRKASEYQRLSEVRFPTGLGMGEMCKAAVCLELSCRGLGIAFEKDKALKICGSDAKTYQNAYMTLCNVLDIKIVVPVKELAVRFGSVRLINPTEKLKKKYQERLKETIPPQQYEAMDFSREVFTAVAFYLTGRRMKIKVNRQDLLLATNTRNSEFIEVCKSMVKLCFPGQAKKTQEKKRRIQEQKQKTEEKKKRKKNNTTKSTTSISTTTTKLGTINKPVKRQRKISTEKENDTPLTVIESLIASSSTVDNESKVCRSDTTDLLDNTHSKLSHPTHIEEASVGMGNPTTLEEPSTATINFPKVIEATELNETSSFSIQKKANRRT